MRLLVLSTILLAISTNIAAEQTNFSITVKQRSYRYPNGTPFMSVGVFEIHRGTSKYEGAACPDLSNNDGKLSCSITCTSTEKDGKLLRLVPPSKTPVVRGYVVPPSTDVQLSGCTVLSRIPDFVYVDSRTALAEALLSSPELKGLVISVNTTAGYRFADANIALAAFKRAASQKPGFEALQKVTSASGILTEALQGENNIPEFKQFAAYTVGTNNVVLQEIAKANLEPGAAAQVKTSGDIADYYRNLKVIEVGLEGKMGRTPNQNQLLNFIQKSKATPFVYSKPPEFPVDVKTNQ